MCVICRDLEDGADRRKRILADRHSREQLAELLTVLDGRCPHDLVPNTLDEEPHDGLLANGAIGHFAWRDRLRHADGQLAMRDAERLGYRAAADRRPTPPTPPGARPRRAGGVVLVVVRTAVGA